MIIMIKRTDRVVFARIGWMTFYAGIVPGDARLIGGGSYNDKDAGSEKLNFAPYRGRVYGFVQGIRSSPLSLERIASTASDAESVDSTLVIFVSRRPSQRGQVIVGWYVNATVNYDAVADPRVKRFDTRVFNVVARPEDAVLLPTDQRWHSIPTGKGAFGQSNVCYARDADGNPKNASWIDRAIDYVQRYRGPNLVVDRDVETQNQAAEQAEAVHAAGQGQGFASTAAERRAIEEHAMRRARIYFLERFTKIEDVSRQKGVLDLRCGSGGRTSVHVEVKGTTTNGASIILTRGELERVRRGKTALYVLHSIKLAGGRATGGQESVLHPWEIEEKRLTPINYMYRMPTSQD
jgi:hypothetical protein